MSSSNRTTASYDAIVVGGRVAGTAAAKGLAERGWRVALVERKPHELGMTLSVPICYPRALAQFKKHGLLPVIESILPQLHRVDRLNIRLNKDTLISGRPPLFEGFDYACILLREVLDDALLQHVLSTYPDRITYYPGHRVEGLLTDASGQVTGVRAVASNDHPVELHAPLTIGADGRMSKIAELVQAPKSNVRRSYTSIAYSYLRGVEWDGLADINITPGIEHRMAAVSQVRSDGLQVLGVFFPVAQYPKFAANTQAELLTSLQHTPELKDRIAHIEWAGRPLHLNPAVADGYFRPAGGPGWALVGDATHYKDPASGQGIHDALYTTGCLLNALDTMTQGNPLTNSAAGATWTRTMQTMQRQRDKTLKPMYDYTYRFAEALTREPTRIERTLFQAIATDPKLTAKFLGISSGATRVQDFNRAAPFYLLRYLLHI